MSEKVERGALLAAWNSAPRRLQCSKVNYWRDPRSFARRVSFTGFTWLFRITGSPGV